MNQAGTDFSSPAYVRNQGGQVNTDESESLEVDRCLGSGGIVLLYRRHARLSIRSGKSGADEDQACMEKMEGDL